ncbi:MAG: glycosyltransferase family 4 protein, partial [Bacteroidaceae bacterium]|nr:glycosyltransferase family 4 protein [Bacteroidaceae bacterium]
MIGFDGKRAAQNRTGLGNYSRFVVRGLSRFSTAERLLLYVPKPGKAMALEGVDKERGVVLRSPDDYSGCWRHVWKRLRSLWRVWGVTDELAEDGVQIFHGLSNELPLNIRRAKGVKSVVTIHDLIFLRDPQYYKPIDRWIYRYKFRRACEQADRVIAVSECTKRDIIHFFGTPADKIEVVYQGCDDRFRQQVPGEIKEKVRARYQLPARFVLYVGSIEERKNLLLLAEAMPLLKDRDVQVVAVGRRTSYGKRIDTFIQRNGLDGRFRMMSGVPFADLPALYQMAEVFVYPSRFEGFGIPLLEALCSGTPAIGCTGSCLEEA